VAIRGKCFLLPGNHSLKANRHLNKSRFDPIFIEKQAVVSRLAGNAEPAVKNLYRLAMQST
jgi:hypothetical protein